MRLPWQTRQGVGSEPHESIARSATAARDERISEYLDGFLSRPHQADIEADAERDPDARLALEGMRAVRASLGELGMVRAPRSFTLAPQAAPRPRGLPRLELYARLGTAVAALALSVITLVPALTGGATLEERSTTSMSGSFDTAQPATEAAKQGAGSGGETAPAAAPAAPQSAPATAAAGSRSAAPTLDGPAGTASTADAGAPAPTLPRSTPAAELPAPSEQPVELSTDADASDSVLWPVQLGLAVVTSVCAALALGMWFRRRARGGI